MTRTYLRIAARVMGASRCEHCRWLAWTEKGMATHLWRDHGDETPDAKTAAWWARLGLGS